jgi:hypothetical protein
MENSTALGSEEDVSELQEVPKPLWRPRRVLLPAIGFGLLGVAIGTVLHLKVGMSTASQHERSSTPIPTVQSDGIQQRGQERAIDVAQEPSREPVDDATNVVAVEHIPQANPTLIAEPLPPSPENNPQENIEQVEQVVVIDPLTDLKEESALDPLMQQLSEYEAVRVALQELRQEAQQTHDILHILGRKIRLLGVKNRSVNLMNGMHADSEQLKQLKEELEKEENAIGEYRKQLDQWLDLRAQVLEFPSTPLPSQVELLPNSEREQLEAYITVSREYDQLLKQMADGTVDPSMVQQKAREQQRIGVHLRKVMLETCDLRLNEVENAIVVNSARTQSLRTKISSFKRMNEFRRLLVTSRDSDYENKLFMALDEQRARVVAELEALQRELQKMVEPLSSPLSKRR